MLEAESIYERNLELNIKKSTLNLSAAKLKLLVNSMPRLDKNAAVYYYGHYNFL